MLNSANERELAYVVLIDAITPIEGYDRVELAHVGGWTVVVGKGEFLPGDPAIYFEIDSKLPEVEPFTNMEFLAKKKFKITTQKMCKSLSQGLLMSAKNFGWYISNESMDKKTPVIVDKNDYRYSGPVTSDTFTINLSGVSSGVVGVYIRIFYETGCGQAWKDTNVILREDF